MNTTEDKPSESSKKLDAKDMLEVMKRAVICENGEVKKIQF